MLVDRAATAGVAGHVVFDDTYRDLESLTELIQSADLVVLPYDSRDQVTSGVWSTRSPPDDPSCPPPFRTRSSCSASGAGIVVPQRDPEALADGDPIGPDQPASSPRRWPPKPDGWRPNCRGRLSLAGTRDSAMPWWRRSARWRSSTLPSFGHVLSMTDDIGMFEHADHDVPRREHGYCVDDVARLLIVGRPGAGRPSSRCVELARTAFRFLATSQRRDGSHAEPSGGERSLARSPQRSRTAGGAASGRSAPRPVGRRRTGCGRVPCPISTTASRNARPISERWRSRPSAPPRSSSSNPATSVAATCSPTRSRGSARCRRTRVGRGPNPD